MKRETLVILVPIVFLVLFVCGCSHEPDNVAVADDGVKISFLKKGEGDPAIVFVHGWSNNKGIWDEQIKYFSKDHETVALDLAGFGESGDNRAVWTIPAFGRDVRAVVRKLNLRKVVLVGFSMGGPVVIEATKMMPDRVIGLVIVDVLQNVDMKYSPEMISRTDSVLMDIVTHPTLEKFAPYVKRNREARFQRALADLKGGPREGWSESLKATLQWANDSCAASLQKIHVPVVAINSDRVPTDVEALRKYAPSFKAKIIPDVGHVIMWDAPVQFDSVLEESVREFGEGALRQE